MVAGKLANSLSAQSGSTAGWVLVDCAAGVSAEWFGHRFAAFQALSTNRRSISVRVGSGPGSRR